MNVAPTKRKTKNENTSNPGNNEALARELVMRLVAYPGDPRTKNPQLLIGKIPENLPFDLPLPEGSQVFGSLMRSSEIMEIILDAPGSQEQIINFYKERLSAEGWNEFDPMRMHMGGGFTHTGIPGGGTHITFCRSNRGPSLTLMTHAGKGPLTDVRLHLDASRESSCAQQTRMRRHHGMEDSLIPNLEPPVGARQMGGGAGGGGSSWNSSATLEMDTAMDAPTLAAHYEAQLEKAKWTRSDGGTGGPTAWSSWTFQDENSDPWRGIFFILKMPDTTGHYWLQIKVDMVEGGEPKSGWFSYAPLS